MQQSYYTAYWNNAKRPKRLDKVIKDIYKDNNGKEKPAIDIEKEKEKFLKRKRRFEELGGKSEQKSHI